MPFAALIDYGMGNLRSVANALEKAGASLRIISSPQEAAGASGVILPGVGNFGDGMKNLNERGFSEFVLRTAESGKPLLGICLGMQLLFKKSYEFGEYEGLGLIPGEVVPMKGRLPEGFKIPHIGWNALTLSGDAPIFRYLRNGDHMYFVHSFFADRCEESVIAKTEYGIPLTAAVGRGNIFGCQFHPEKSGDKGLLILKAFCETEGVK